jgi:SAM-dependent methyltransferase
MSFIDFINDRINVEKSSILNFVKFARTKVQNNSIFLDAGAGKCQYKSYFSHTNYISTDTGYTHGKNRVDVISDLLSLPFRENSIDAILNTQCLEHVKEPQRVISEFYRILKPGGYLFLTAPQGWGIHDAPHDYFRFTSYGLEYLFNSAGFEAISITPRGGYFWYMGYRLKVLNTFFRPAILRKIIGIFFVVIVPFLFYYLDRLDKEKSYTLGYSCYCRKNPTLK